MRILVSEPQESFRKLMVTCLEARHFFILQASNREEMLDLLKQKVDVLLVDTTIIQEEVPLFLAKLRESYPDLNIIITTPTETSQGAIEALTNGALDYLIKPFTVERIADSIQKAFPKDRILKTAEEDFDGKGFLSLDSLPSVQRHPLMKKALGLLNNVAESNITVLLSGPSGSGKEIFARTLHMRSKRARNNFVGLNCASVPESLLEAELFGCERGAYTGSVSQRIGKFELAHKGTLLLDEVSEMNVGLQSKLLRVIQEREMYRVGGDRSISLDVRIIATTNRDLYDWVKKGHFREDLFYRLNVIAIEVPPLRERLEDIPVLAQYILDRFHKENKEKKYILTMDAVQQLCQYNWPGNIRELENVLIRTTFLTTGKNITKIYFDEREKAAEMHSSEASGKVRTLEAMEYDMIRKALEQHGGNRTHAANALGISVRTLRNKIQIYPELDQPAPIPEKNAASPAL